MRRILPPALLTLALASCVPALRPASRPAPPPATPALPAAPPQQDWRDVPLTPGRWTWQGTAGSVSGSRFGLPGQAPVFTVRCDFGAREVVLSGMAGGSTLTVTTSFGAFTLAAAGGSAQLGARDSRLDRIAFSRGRFLVDAPGRTQLVLPSWPEVARVIEDCRS